MFTTCLNLQNLLFIVRSKTVGGHTKIPFLIHGVSPFQAPAINGISLADALLVMAVLSAVTGDGVKYGDSSLVEIICGLLG